MTSSTRRTLQRTAISLVAAALLAALLRRGGLPIVPPRSAFASVQPWAVFAYLASTTAATYLRTYRWVYLLRPLAGAFSALRVLGMGLVGFAAIFLAPMRLGELVRPALVAREGVVPFSKALGTVAAERIVDGLLMALTLLAGLVSSRPRSPLPERVGSLPIPAAAVNGAAWSAFVLFAGAFVVMAVVYRLRRWLRPAIDATVGRASPRVAALLEARVGAVVEGFSFLPSREHAGPFFRDTVFYWGTNLVGTWLLLRGCSVPATPAELCVVLGLLGVGSLIPSGPGLFGVFQLSAYCGLALFFDEETVLGPGAAFVFITYATQLVVTLAGAVIGYGLLRGTERVATANG